MAGVHVGGCALDFGSSQYMLRRMNTLLAILALSVSMLAASSSLAAELPFGTAPGSPEAALKKLEDRLIGMSWSFEEKKSWVRFEKDGALYVGWAKSAFGKWKVTGEHEVEFSPWTNGRKETLKLNASYRTGTITNEDGKTSKTERTGR